MYNEYIYVYLFIMIDLLSMCCIIKQQGREIREDARNPSLGAAERRRHTHAAGPLAVVLAAARHAASLTLPPPTHTRSRALADLVACALSLPPSLVLASALGHVSL